MNALRLQCRWIEAWNTYGVCRNQTAHIRPGWVFSTPQLFS